MIERLRALAADQSRARQHGKMRGHGVLRNCEQAGEFACSDAIRLATYEELERLKASGLSKGRKSGDSYGRIHRIDIARFIDICHASKITGLRDGYATFAQRPCRRLLGKEQ